MLGAGCVRTLPRTVRMQQLTNMTTSNTLISGQKMPVMAHLVLGYPTLASSVETAKTYIAAGVSVLELQIPFSHPTADGPVITQACREATENQHVSVQDCVDVIRQLRAEHPEQEIMVMSYLNRIYTYGFQRLIDTLSSLNIRHLIVPDLPVDSTLAVAHFGSGKVQLVPVLAANISDARLNHLCHLGFDFFYLMSDFKITGSGFSLNPRLEAVIARIKTQEALYPVRIGIGFGISTPEQAQLVCKSADIAIIGSALITAQERGELSSYLELLRAGLQG